MNYLLSFVFAGSFCMIAQIVYEKTKLTQGHIVTSCVFLGAMLSFFNIYDKLIAIFHSGATSLITNYGHLLYQSAKIGAKSKDYFQIFIHLMQNTSGIVSFAIVLSLLGGFFKGAKP